MRVPLKIIVLPDFGATASEGIVPGILVIMSYEPTWTKWLFAEPAPISTESNAVEIETQVLGCATPVMARQLGDKWFHTSLFFAKSRSGTSKSIKPITFC